MEADLSPILEKAEIMVSIAMARQFDIPFFYRAKITSQLKKARRERDRYKKDLSPSVLSLGPLRFKIARHFGFCFGVENAIEIAYRALEEKQGQRIFLLSEMIHNPRVNLDLKERGIQFIQKSDGTRLFPLKELKKKDIVIIPAFGTTVELLKEIEDKGIETKTYNTTCPFVERVWNKASQLGRSGYTVIIHGHDKHEETRASFSHARLTGPTLVIGDIEEASLLAGFIRKEKDPSDFYQLFAGRHSEGFNIERNLNKIGLVNQTTMLATETQEIGNYLKAVMKEVHPEDDSKEHFADTRDTLCYATAENQEATRSLLHSGGDLAVVVGGYNSSNTSHLVELLGEKTGGMKEELAVYYIQDAKEMKSSKEISHLDIKSKKRIITKNWLPHKEELSVLITSGASCPDALVDEVIERIASFYGLKEHLEREVEKYLKLEVEPCAL